LIVKRRRPRRRHRKGRVAPHSHPQTLRLACYHRRGLYRHRKTRRPAHFRRPQIPNPNRNRVGPRPLSHRRLPGKDSRVRVNRRPRRRPGLQRIAQYRGLHLHKVIQINIIHSQPPGRHQRQRLQNRLARRGLQDPVARKTRHRLPRQIKLERRPAPGQNRPLRNRRRPQHAADSHKLDRPTAASILPNRPRRISLPQPQTHLQRLVRMQVKPQRPRDLHNRIGPRRRIIGRQPQPRIGRPRLKTPIHPHRPRAQIAPRKTARRHVVVGHRPVQKPAR